MLMRLVMIVLASVASIFVINYTGFYILDYTWQNILYGGLIIIAIMILYKILTKFLKLFLFVVIVIPVLGICFYYLYSYITGEPPAFMQF
ncbi:hypothetical protein GCM10007275_01650 [Jeotgalicoccus coquinae]|uniref:Uncharacterized protein n=2 Tax=Jeotgalicoccus coquinae TaxID=709509 RepID=A0A6V7R8P5_9STAP|nr:hypothetical protein [Jeotgalicoccus coquinae]GGE10079.1 hypothetical protein GCM10007275_01650 [Jeotgalicoccus coquinae]CAD2073368.1 hypothetical protein JEOCOQ751_00515 [Jeotgalicoccus coquinae]